MAGGWLVRKKQKRKDKKKGRMNTREKTMKHKSFSNQSEATGRGHVSYLLCPDPRCTHYLDENVALLLQAREEKKHNQIR